MSGEFWTYLDNYTGRSGPPPPSMRRVPVRVAQSARTARKYTPQQARLAGACCLAVIVFAVICSLTHSSPPPSPAYGGSTSGPVQMYPHSPKVAAAALAAEAHAAGHVVRGATRLGTRIMFRGTILRGLGGYGSYTPGGSVFHGFGGFGFGSF